MKKINGLWCQREINSDTAFPGRVYVGGGSENGKRNRSKEVCERKGTRNYYFNSYKISF